jgi:hypothetical protein
VATPPLDVYLTDHLAGAAAGCELAARLRDQHAGTPQEPFYAELATAIETDRATLDRLIARLGIKRNRAKEAAGWLVEKLSRLKLNERLTGSARLTMLLELETLSLGIEGKLALWKSLMSVAETHPVLNTTDFDELRARAEQQLEGLEPHRLAAAVEALGS